MERLQFRFEGGERVPAGTAPRIVGVVASGNLEVLVEPVSEAGLAVEVNTAAHGFAPIWGAVLDDFFTRHRPAALRISINDAGATPAIVALRLDQAMAALECGDA